MAASCLGIPPAPIHFEFVSYGLKTRFKRLVTVELLYYKTLDGLKTGRLIATRGHEVNQLNHMVLVFQEMSPI